MKFLLLTPANKIDYLSDLFLYFAYNELYKHAKVYINKHPFYLFKGFDKSIGLYGKGFTIGRSINNRKIDNISRLEVHSIENMIKKRQFDQIIWTSIDRFDNYLVLAIASGYEANQLILLDGEDHRELYINDIDIVDKARYYKRELTEKFYREGYTYPISFKFPHNKTILFNYDKVIKSSLLAAMDPRLKESYIFNDERSYYKQYRQAYFAVTTEKGGWDCMRHYEIIANNCLPVFPKFHDCPIYTMHEWDRNLQHYINELWLDYQHLSKDHNVLKARWTELMKKVKKSFLHTMLTDNYINILGV